MTKSSTVSRQLLLLLLVLATMPVSNATQVKWFGNKNNKDPAATAPRSQKYWDKHNIKRPDYAKTDAELRSEGKTTVDDAPSSMGMWILLGLVVAGFVGNKVYQDRQAGGVRLEGGSGSTTSSLFPKTARSREITMVEQREARLARFDADMKAD